MESYQELLLFELREIRRLLEIQAAPVQSQMISQLVQGGPEVRKAHSREVLARAREASKREKGGVR